MRPQDCNCKHCRVALDLDEGRPVMVWSRADLETLLGSGVLAGRVLRRDVLHDDDCAMEPCSCKPWFLLSPVTAMVGGMAS